MTSRRRGAAGLVALLALVGGLEWRRVFDGGPVVGLVVGSAVLPALAALAGTARRRRRDDGEGGGGGRGGDGLPAPLPLTATVSLAALVAYVTAAIVHGPDAGALVDGLLHGWSRILTTTLPVPPDDRLLVLPVVLTWLAVLIGCELVLRVRRPALGLAAPVVAYGVALLFGIGGAGSRLVPATVALAVALAAGAVLAGNGGARAGESARPGRRRAAVSRRTVQATAVVALCAATAGTLAPDLPLVDARTPYDPREVQEPPADHLEAIDPMSLLAGWAKEPEPVLFSVAADRPARWRLAVLDRYDPATGWSREADLRAAGRRLPAPQDGAAGGHRTDTLAQDVTIEGLRGAWVPAADRAVEVTGFDPLVDVDTGVLARRGGLVGGMTYRVVSGVPAEEPDCAAGAAAEAEGPGGPGGRGGPATGPDELPADLVQFTDELVSGASTPCARAQAIETYLTGEDFEFNPDVPSGTTLGRIRDLLQPEEGPGLGTSEQFATAFVLMARAAGLPARVVVGFHGGQEVDGAFQVRAGDAFAWGEVRFAGIGWVAFEPTPVPGDQTPPPEVQESEAQTAPAPTPTTTPTTAPPVVDRPPEAPAGEPTSAVARAARTALTVAAAVLVGLVAVALVLALVRRTRRRRRASAPDPAQRVVGAWRQCLDELRDAGVPADTSDTASDYVARSRSLVGDEPAAAVAPVARLANGVLFGGPPVSDGDAAEAWACVDTLSHLAAARRTPLARLHRALDVRTLTRR